MVVRSSTSGHRRGNAARGHGVLSLAATLPLALAGARHAQANALVVAHERANVPTRCARRCCSTCAPPTRRATRRAWRPTAATRRRGRAARVSRSGRGRPAFVQPVHVGLLRAHFGASPTSGVPTGFHWEARPAPATGPLRHTAATSDDDWVTIDATSQSPSLTGDLRPSPRAGNGSSTSTRAASGSWWTRTNAGPPVLREVQRHRERAGRAARGRRERRRGVPRLHRGRRRRRDVRAAMGRGAGQGQVDPAGGPAGSRSRSIACGSCWASTRRATRVPLGPELRDGVGPRAVHARGERGRQAVLPAGDRALAPRRQRPAPASPPRSRCRRRRRCGRFAS